MKSGVYVSISQLENEDDQSLRSIHQPQSARWKCAAVVLAIALIVSSGFNAHWLYQKHFKPWDLSTQLPTKFAHLKQNIPTTTHAHADYDSLNRTLQDAAWNQPDVEPWNAFIAVSEDYAMAKGLPHSQRWPWDESKGVYIPTGAHELHCVRILRVHLNEVHDGIPTTDQAWQYPHLLHCLNILRESVMCHADDTPMYVGRLHANTLSHETPRAGIGMVKMCRDWKAMMTWARERSACYKPVHWREKGFPEIERYRFCPDGSRPWEAVERVDGGSSGGDESGLVDTDTDIDDR